MKQSGFMLLELIIVIALVALIVGGGFYYSGVQSRKSEIQTGIDAKKRAKEIVEQINKQNQEQQNVIDELHQTTTSTPILKSVQK